LSGAASIKGCAENIILSAGGAKQQSSKSCSLKCGDDGSIRGKVVVVTGLTSLAAITTAVTTAMEMATLMVTAVTVTAVMTTALRVSCSQQATLRVS
jgi:hypothetical protein